MQTVAQALSKCAQALAAHSTMPRDEAEWLLMEVLQVSRASLRAYPDAPLNPDQQQQLAAWIARRQQGEPLAYVLGSQPFWSLQLKVTPDTLIPRPETETLITWILQHFAPETALRVADLGVGSGAIALALALERPRWQIDATDCHAATLAVAAENAVMHGVRNVTFYQGDWCHALPVGAQYAVLISNPPYLDAQDPHLAALQHEPSRALVSAADGLADLLKIVLQARERLVPGGTLVLEHGWTQAPAVLAALQAAGYVQAQSHLDLEQRPRFVTALWQGE